MREQGTTSSETCEDEVVYEVDVFLSKTLAENLYLIQHPTKHVSDAPNQAQCTSAKIKPKQQRLELEFSIDTGSSSYDKSRGEQFAINVDGANPSSEPFFKSSLMDKFTMTATAAEEEFVKNCAIGFLKKGEFHITPLHSLLEHRPNFIYMDKMDHLNKKTHSSVEEEEEEEEAVAVTVRFEGPNAEKDKQMREKSYQFLQQKYANEPWINLNYHPLDSHKAKVEYGNLVCSQMYKDVTSCFLTPEEYVKALIPESLRCIGSQSRKKQKPVSDQIKQLMSRAHVLKFSTILDRLRGAMKSEKEIDSVKNLIQQIAVLVQGCWVVKSELVYPENSVSPLTGTSSKYLINARDYVIWLFTKSRVITRHDVLSEIYLPHAELLDILTKIAVKCDRGWEFKYPYDFEFVESHRSIVQSQEVKWDYQYKKLVKELLLGGLTQKLPCPVLPRKQKRHSRSSLSEDGDESGTDTSSSSLKDSKAKRISSPKKRMHPSPVKHPTKAPKPYHIATLDVSPTFLETSPSDEIKAQLKECVEEALRNQYVMTLSSLKELVSESHLSALCSRTDIEQLIEEALISCGAQKLKNKWPQNTTPEPLYAFSKFGNKLDRYRNTLLELFSTTARTRTNFLIKTVEDELREIISENDCRQIFEEYCIYKSGFFYLKGTIALDS